MLKSSLRLFTAITRNTFNLPILKTYGLINNNLAAFCKTEKHDSNEHKHQHRFDPSYDPKDKDHERYKRKQEAKQKKEAEEEVQKEESIKQQQPSQEETVESTKHTHHEGKCDHGHHHESHKHAKHEHDHRPHVNLSKLSFQELIEMKTEQSVRHAHHIYEREVRKLKQMKEEKENLRKSIDFFKKVEEEIKEKEQKLAENIKHAEEEATHSKRRAEKQIEESKTYAVTKIAKELLEVADCIANCKKYAEQHENKDKYIESVITSQQIIKDILKKFGIEEFDPINQQYDPNTQESLLQIPTPPGFKANQVAVTMRTGYTIKGRLLRSARVGIFS